MGCARSREEVDPPSTHGGSQSGQPLTTREIMDRIDAPPKSETIQIGGFTLRYAYISQRGFYPDDRDKANQDAYGVAIHYDSDPNKALFTVYDGHGKEGDLCAVFCKETLPGVLSKQLRESRTVEDGLKKAFNKTNDQLHKNRNVDDSLSGTTAVAVYLEGRDMWVANVGDSRAIVVQEHEGQLLARPLSSDQTPYRKDERERVKASGARVMSMDQIEGLEPIHENWGDVDLGVELDEGGDPPRIWSPFGEYPGTAFTRSMGDVIAEELGVTADPEIIHRKIHPSDRFIVIASDGVFEFLTNQSVADMVAKYPDPLDACKKVVQESYDLWLQFEVRTDDITIVCAYIEGIDADKKGAAVEKDADLDVIAIQGLRPVRRERDNSLRRKRQIIMANEPIVGWRKPSPPSSGAEEEQYRPEDRVVPKSDVERRSILQAIKTNFLFSHTTDKQKEILVNVMRKAEVKAGEWVIQQGARGECFYIIDKGAFEVRVNHEKEVVTDKKDAGVLVHVYEPTDKLKPCFGHLALMYSKPRSASVFAKTNGSLWELDRLAFRQILMKRSRREVAYILRQVPVLQTLTLLQVHQLCDVLKEETYEPGQKIISQGEVGDTFYVVEEGCVVVRQRSTGGVEKELRKMRKYDCFGERALLTAEPRSADVIAVTKVKCLALSQNAFEMLLGPLSGLINEDRIKREQKQGVPMLQELQLLGEVSKDNLGQTNACRLPQNATPFTLRTMWKSDVVAQQQQAMVLKSSEMLKHLSEAQSKLRKGCVAVPPLVSTYNMEASLHVLHQVSAVCTLSALLEEKKELSQDIVRHVTACLVLGIETLHNCDILYRALSPELIFLDSRGYAVMMDYRLAKLGLNNALTLCGTPEYLAPEQVGHQEHSKSVDFWGLGVLIYELTHGSSPFAADSEINIYKKISSHRAGMLEIPTSFAPALGDLIDRLLHHDPEERLGSKAEDMVAIKTHQWFAGFDWGGVQAGECFNQELRHLAHGKSMRLDNLEGELPDGGKDYLEDQSIWSRF